MSDLSYRMVKIGNAPAGLLGLEELFNELHQSGCSPEDSSTADKLISGVRKHNFVPRPALEDYKEGLLREYHYYYQTRMSGRVVKARDYGQWEGYPREQIPWFPAVSEGLCNGCGKCIDVCPKDVFLQDEDGKVSVVEPFLCIVGCCFCKSACDPEAILMPNRKMLDQYRHGQRKVT